jgi:hypothetical protein
VPLQWLQVLMLPVLLLLLALRAGKACRMFYELLRCLKMMVKNSALL